MWRSRAATVPFELSDGLKVRVFGNIRLYEKAGRYQIDVLSIESAGLGELQVLFEQLKQKLYDEGLFNSEFKKPIPKYPQRIAVLTSPTGAALRDIISVFKREGTIPSTQPDTALLLAVESNPPV